LHAAFAEALTAEKKGNFFVIKNNEDYTNKQEMKIAEKVSVGKNF